MSKRAYIFDLDGTLSDCAHRRYLVDGTAKKDYAAFNTLGEFDVPIAPVANLFKLFSRFQETMGIDLIVCTGRMGTSYLKIMTKRWLINNGLFYNRLMMRKEGDNRPDHIVKSEMLDTLIADGYEIELVFDDRKSVVKMWRERGLICLQCAEGDF